MHLFFSHSFAYSDRILCSFLPKWFLEVLVQKKSEMKKSHEKLEQKVRHLWSIYFTAGFISQAWLRFFLELCVVHSKFSVSSSYIFMTSFSHSRCTVILRPWLLALNIMYHADFHKVSRNCELSSKLVCMVSWCIRLPITHVWSPVKIDLLLG